MNHEDLRKIGERKAEIMKRLLKMGIMGNPGPQTRNVRLKVYLTVLVQAAHAINATPYLAQGNYGLITPAHFIIPWITSQVMVRELLESFMLELRRTRYNLVHKMVKIHHVMMEELCMELDRLKQSRLKLSKNKSVDMVNPGDLVMLRRTRNMNLLNLS